MVLEDWYTINIAFVIAFLLTILVAYLLVVCIILALKPTRKKTRRYKLNHTIAKIREYDEKTIHKIMHELHVARCSICLNK
jgi:maltodextrin utilization protein YvdJ